MAHEGVSETLDQFAHIMAKRAGLNLPQKVIVTEKVHDISVSSTQVQINPELVRGANLGKLVERIFEMVHLLVEVKQERHERVVAELEERITKDFKMLTRMERKRASVLVTKLALVYNSREEGQ